MDDRLIRRDLPGNRSRAGGRPPAFDAGRYKERNTVERCLPSSNSFAPSPPATTNATICTRPLSTSHLSGYGYETPFPIYGI
jgi:hypothetical protein